MESALKDYAAQVVAGLNDMTAMVLGELTKGDRMKIKTMAPTPSILSTSPQTGGSVDAANLEATQDS